jgi:18S rRNA (guanine1575-N7)-methyltransferase
MITQQAMKAGFTGGLVVDYPNSTRAKKYIIKTPHISFNFKFFFFVLRMFLCLFAGGQVQQLPTGLTGEEGSEELPTQARYDKER